MPEPIDHDKIEVDPEQFPKAHGDVLIDLGRQRLQSGDPASAKALFRQAADRSSTAGRLEMVRLGLREGDLDGVRAVIREAADAGDLDVLEGVARLARASRDGEFPEGAECLSLVLGCLRP
ncbi:hypothetical protein [Streptomyces chartreusis]|uniref:Tetratricopeptide repeat protein n=1 Tax=Streptomyces chartreusis TaxID=1969 RepID=A0A7H8TE72_STRCX|nr:hypothetical protein [Streptomyces chartreusis]QKZ20340.1 hypothetical protein HUT05_25110 [Streptomyces chartreusis]